jgi:hypothetical protein
VAQLREETLPLEENCFSLFIFNFIESIKSISFTHFLNVTNKLIRHAGYLVRKEMVNVVVFLKDVVRNGLQLLLWESNILSWSICSIEWCRRMRREQYFLVWQWSVTIFGARREVRMTVQWSKPLNNKIP